MTLPYLTGEVTHEETAFCEEDSRMVVVVVTEGNDNS